LPSRATLTDVLLCKTSNSPKAVKDVLLGLHKAKW